VEIFSSDKKKRNEGIGALAGGLAFFTLGIIAKRSQDPVDNFKIKKHKWKIKLK